MVLWSPAAFQIVAAVSVASSSAVVLTALFFRPMRMNLFVQIIAFISLADIGGNAPYLSTERPKDGNWWCSLQGFMGIYFYSVSWLWTTVLVRFLYEIALYGKLLQSRFVTNALCWGVPLVLTLLVLTTNTYGRTDGNPHDVCAYGGNYQTGYIYHMISVYGLFSACVVYMLFMGVHISLMKRWGQLHTSRETLDFVTHAVRLYPISMLILWTPHLFAVILGRFVVGPINQFAIFDAIATILKIMHGFVTAVIFFANSNRARHCWLRLLGFKSKLLPDRLTTSVVSSDAPSLEAIAVMQEALAISSQQPSEDEVAECKDACKDAISNPMSSDRTDSCTSANRSARNSRVEMPSLQLPGNGITHHSDERV